MKALLCHAIAVTLVLFLGACVNPQAQREMEMRERAEFESLLTKVERLEERVEGLQTAQESIQRDVDELRTDNGRSAEELQDEIDRVQVMLKAVQDRQAGLKTEVVEEISGKMAEIMSSQGSGRGTPVASGYEHVVQRGETLSEIASAYHVSVEAIVRANNLKNPDDIKIGQTLFVPE